MNTIDGLIKKAKLELSKNNQSTGIIGNRPHFPMLVLFDDEISRTEHDTIFEALSRIWPQAIKHLVSYRYSVGKDSEFIINSCEDNVQIATSAFLDGLDNSKKARDVFESMQQWCIYNIIDTSRFNSCEEFKNFFYAYKQINSLISDAHKTMLIVLLNDSSAKRSIAKEIRIFLSDKKEYDATVIVSNRDRNNQMYDMSELSRIVANILLLSNNDSVFEADNADYGHRVSLLYDNSSHIVSYILLDKPINKIGIQIINAALDESLRVLESTKPFDAATWTKKFKFENSRSDICENYIRRVEPTVDSDLFLHLPMRSIPKKIDISDIQYSQLKDYIFDDVFQGFVGDYCSRQLAIDFDPKECIDEFKTFVLKTFTAAELCNLSDDIIENMINNLSVGTQSENLAIYQYFKQCVHLHLRKSVIYPAFKATLRELRSEAVECVGRFNQFRKEYKTYLPLKMDEVLGSFYSNMATAFFQTEQGGLAIREILIASNHEEDYADKAIDCLRKIVENNRNVFAMSFIDEWSQRLGQSGDMIYKKISNELTNGADDAIRLCGNYALNKKLKVFMLHTGDMNGSNPTELYGHVKQTFYDDSLVQYFNTGYDDAMEAITFIECRGTDLII